MSQHYNFRIDSTLDPGICRYVNDNVKRPNCIMIIIKHEDHEPPRLILKSATDILEGTEIRFKYGGKHEWNKGGKDSSVDDTQGSEKLTRLVVLHQIQVLQNPSQDEFQVTKTSSKLVSHQK